MKNAKTLPVLDGSGDRALYVDDLTRIDEFGPTTHLLFSVCRSELDGTRYRVAVQRLIIPTTLRTVIGRQLLAGGVSGNEEVPWEQPQMH